MSWLDKIRDSAGNFSRRSPDFIGGVSVEKCRGRTRITTLKSAERLASVGVIPHYFCCLCHGYHIEHPIDEVELKETTHE